VSLAASRKHVPGYFPDWAWGFHGDLEFFFWADFVWLLVVKIPSQFLSVHAKFTDEFQVFQRILIEIWPFNEKMPTLFEFGPIKDCRDADLIVILI